MQLDELCERLCNALNMSGPSAQHPHMNQILTRKGDAGDITAAEYTTALSCERAYRVKVEWRRRSAPMPALQKAVEALLDAFWTQGSTMPKYQISNPSDLHVAVCPSPQDFKWPDWMVFLETSNASNARADPGVWCGRRLKWTGIPSELELSVIVYFWLFCFELSELGYQVLEDRAHVSTDGRKTYSINVRHARPLD